MNISDINKQRIKDLDARGKSINEIRALTGVSQAGIESVLRPAKEPRQAAPAKAGDNGPTPAQIERARLLKGNRFADGEEPPEPRPGQAFKDWAQEDYAKFIEEWQAEPSFDKAATREGLTVSDIKYLVQRLRVKGVPLRLPRKLTADFEALRLLAESKLTEKEKALLEKRRAVGRKNVAKAMAARHPKDD